MKKNAEYVSNEEGKEVQDAVNIMSDKVEEALGKGGDDEACELWKIHRDTLNQHYANGGKSRHKKVAVHPVLLNWAIAFLAKNSATCYREVEKIMLLPSISYVYKKMAEMVSRTSDKGYSIHIQTLETLSQRAKKEKWTAHQRTVCLAQDSAHISKGVEHDHVSNTIVGCDESFRIGIGKLSQIFHNMAQEVKSATEEGTEQLEGTTEAATDGQSKKENSILDELRLAKETLVFKANFICPTFKEKAPIVASINIEQVTPEIIATVEELLQDTLPAYGFYVGFGTSDAAGCNWVGYKSLATVSVGDVLPSELKGKYPDVDFNFVNIYEDPVTGGYVIFLPDMPHLTKNIVTALELSGSKFSKRSIKYGKCPVNLIMVEDVWLVMGGATNQMHESKLTYAHLHKNAYSRMNVLLAMQILSATVARMIRAAIQDERIKLQWEVKGMYNHLANLCDNWNKVVDICNGKDGPHTPKNAEERQSKLLDVLSWFSIWRKSHLKKVSDGEATEYNFFADETWFCIRGLLLSHVAAIQIYCVEKNEEVRPGSLNTDCVEWFFGDARQMIGGSHNKPSARGMGHATAKASACAMANHNLVGNNRTGGGGRGW